MKNSARIPLLFRRSLAFGLALAITLTTSSAFACDKQRRLSGEINPSPLEADTAIPLLHDGTPCVNGTADGFPCLNVDFLHNHPPGELSASSGNDIWGWTDPVSGTEYALMGLNNGVSFIDLSEPEEATIIGKLPTHTGNSTWRDIKVFADHAFVVSEASGHGMQIFDLKDLRNVTTPPVTFSNTAHYSGFGSAHNIVINEDTGFAYAVGTSDCSGGLHMVDINDPVNPVFAGCFSSDGYTHDAQCITYNGPDTEHVGQEICFNSNEDTLTIVDVTDKSNPQMLSRIGYAGSGYTHQGWVTEDQTYFLLDDEVDENSFGHNTRTYIWDISDLDLPVVTSFTTDNPASDHNQYVVGDYAYQANYRSGLRIMDISDLANGNLTEVAFFDVVPGSDAPGFAGAWSVYPYFESGVIVVSSIEGGFFALRPILCEDPVAPGTLNAQAAGDNAIDLSWANGGGLDTTFNVYRSFGSCPGGDFEQVASGLTSTNFSDNVSGQVDYSYVVTSVDSSGFCESVTSACSATSTTGICNAPPIFAGLESVANPGDPSCLLNLDWNDATANCGSAVTYNVYRSTDAGFTPLPSNRVATGLNGTSWTDPEVASDVTYYYIVRATDLGSGTEDENLVVLSGTPTGPSADGTWNAGAEPGDPGVIYSTGNSFTGGPQGGDSFINGQVDFSKLHIGWEPSDARAFSGDRSYFSTYANGQCTAIITPPIHLSAGESPQLSFQTLYEIESGFDGGVLQISTDGGSNWSLLTPDQGYPGSFISTNDACGFLNGDPSFTGTNLSWNLFTADLSPWNGQEIQVRWIFSTDGGLTLEGWYIDDITITHADVPSACFAGLFRDGFELGNLSAWSSTSP